MSEKSLLIMPPTGGTNYIDSSYAREFCADGYDVFVANSWTDDTGKSTDLEIHQGFYSRMLNAVELILAENKSPFVGVLGTSLGGLYAAVATSKIERFDAVFTIVAGIPITEVIVNSDQPAMRNLANARREKYGFANDQDYLTGLEKAFTLEPIEQKNNFHIGKDLGVVIAENDTTVPTKQQHQLRDFWKPQKLISLETSHFWGIVRTWLFHDDEIVEFFDKSAIRKLGRKTGP